MPQIRPLTDLRNHTTIVANAAHEEREPVFITKNGYADLVVMSIEAYEDSFARLEVYDKLAQSQAEMESGQKPQAFDKVFSKYRKKYGDANGKI
ncbi:MAG: type II toxin-antitoxin system Phd/YefM family antitoxin [Clostridiales bacterium]|jgi:prevent-host-death family protein|nr:type II toxin-antitoxin system Phd/YefM family antitoxin [Clostridiales bacterium]